MRVFTTRTIVTPTLGIKTSSLDYHGLRNIIPRLNGAQDKSSSLEQPQQTTSHTYIPTRNVKRKSKTRP